MTAAAPTTTEPATVLIVEDDEETVLPLRHTLEREGLAVELARSCREALARLRTSGISLVVVDHALSDADGSTLAELIRRERLAPAVLLLTAGRATPAARVPEEGTALACLTKPFAVREFLARTRLLLRRSEQQLPTPRCGVGSDAQVPQNVV